MLRSDNRPRCPSCRSILIVPFSPPLWKCRYCHSVFLAREIMREQSRLTDFGVEEVVIQPIPMGFDP